MILVAALACVALQVEAVSDDGPSTLLSVELPSGAATTVGVLDHRLNALGYSEAQDAYFGVTPLGDIVRMDHQGAATTIGHVPHSGVVQAVAGAVHGDRFYVRSSGAVYVIDIDPGSPGYLGLVSASVLWPISFVLSVDDFDYNPADGLLYGVATKLLGHPEVVTIDPTTGWTRPLDPAITMPDGPGYGAAAFGPDGALYATNNDQGGESLLYRVALDGSGSVTLLSGRPAARTIDSAGCYAAATPPIVLPPTTTPPVVVPPTAPPTTTTTPAPLPEVPAVPPPAPTTTTTPSPVPAGATPLPPDVPPPPSSPAPTTPRSVPPPVFKPDRPVEEVVAVADRRTETKRRWSLAVLLLVIGAGAVAAQRARRA
ncbi:DUF6923 family protein [Umezawaea tangerina]|uniref:DUF6923 domain-containing protein n=1 Tax=Umezawaea tangerina TaxID=84725 RepID=A0A2T0TEG1_9PSEU|nr:hypothetical protein [Umezawaea tangerina]PRY44008.1 hypothetical protein CLV43_103759 [Umezawaea tangerina]